MPVLIPTKNLLELDAKGVLGDASKTTKGAGAIKPTISGGAAKSDKIVSICAGLSQTIVGTKNGNVIVWGDGMTKPVVIKSVPTTNGLRAADPLNSLQFSQPTFKRYISMSAGRSGAVLISKDVSQTKKVTNQIQAITGIITRILH